MGQIQYSEKYFDDTYEYRHVVLPPDVAKTLPKNRLLSELGSLRVNFAKPDLKIGVDSSQRGTFLRTSGGGVQQSRGWVHYAIHRPEPHIMLFRRPLNYQQQQEAQAAMLQK
ncbi:uncharacterized protein A4U43_C04F33390 [Asparagus officinalis]|uniref:Cyclin-dependent kinases regulatory subunit n=1 Tax=Asparagus officinalis TaxID=4686 RepID=A0A5P1F891_ASPOF|nr:uncharacterized protein A4U43_C04F33390 [Asparagus officinalis]